MADNSRVFEHNGTKYKVTKPTLKAKNGGQREWNKTWNQALSDGALVQEKLDDYLEEQGLWNDKKQIQLKTLQAEINQYEEILDKGGVKTSVGRKAALDLIEGRQKIADMLTVKSDLNSTTAQGQANNMRFNYLVYASLVYNETGKPCFKNFDEFLNSIDDEFVETASGELMTLMYYGNVDFRTILPEYQFLKRFKYIDDNLRFINKVGHLTDREGRLVNDEGFLVDKEGGLVDEEGEPIKDEGPAQFLDDDGKVIEDNVEGSPSDEEEVSSDESDSGQTGEDSKESVSTE